MGEESDSGKPRRLKRVRIFGEHFVVYLYNGSGSHWGKCGYLRRKEPYITSDPICKDGCHLAEGHDGPCCCGNPECRHQRLNDSTWLRKLTLRTLDENSV
jgi:hypothetical protein